MTAAIRPSTGAAHARILAVGGYRPERVVTNAEICERIDSSDEWIRERSGIRERRFARADETVVDMATAASEVAITRAGIDPSAIGMVLLATVSWPYQTPAAATEVASRIGAMDAAAADLSAACAGFCYGVGMAADMVRGGSAEYVLVIGVEKLSDWTDPTDRSTAFIFADGAGAVVIGPSDEPAIGPTIWGADGAQRDAITMTRNFVQFRDTPGAEFPALAMQGQQVFRWAVGEMPKVCRRALDAAGVAPEQLDVFVPHQANARIVDAMVRGLKLPEHVTVSHDIEFTGNTSAASIPLAMEAMLESGQARSGDTALLIGFGAGLAYAAQVVTLP